MIKIKRGLNLPIAGVPEQKIDTAKNVEKVAVLGSDFVGLKPSVLVKEGDLVQLGQPLLNDKENPGVNFASPATGKILAVNRGYRRVLESIVIEVSKDEKSPQFTTYTESDLENLAAEKVKEQLIASGLWTAFRVRPFSKIPKINDKPSAIFVTAIDTHPLSANPEVVIGESKQEFLAGLKAISKLTESKVYLCKEYQAAIPAITGGVFEIAEFSGPHPAGLVGTHIHFLHSVSLERKVWHLGYQDVIAIGHLFLKGQISTTRVVAIGGPVAKNPRLLKTRVGASLDELLQGEIKDTSAIRVINGSVFGGKTAEGNLAYISRYANQISLIEEPKERAFFGWLSLGMKKHSVLNIYLSKVFGLKEYNPTTTTNGSERAILPVGSYEKVMPLDILATPLLRYLLIDDIEMAMQLGCLELDEEDLSLCSYVCPGKHEFGSVLRRNLSKIEKEV